MTKLSFIFSARDDDYVKNFINRMEFCVNFNLYQINSLNKLHDVEFVIIDWGGKTKISEKFKVIREEFKKNVKFYYFPPEISEKGNEELPGKFNQEVAINCGIRRAIGNYCLIGHHDILFSKSCWANIFRVIEDKDLKNIFFWIPRFTLNKGLSQKNPNIDDVDNFLKKIFISKKSVEFSTMQHGGGSAAVLSGKNVITDKFGLSENLKVKGRFSQVDADIWQKVSSEFDHIDSYSQGIFCHKLPIYGDSKKNKWLNSNYAKRRLLDFRYNLEFENPDYGLGKVNISYEIPKNQTKNIFLKFDKYNTKIDSFSSNIFYALKNNYYSLFDNFSFKEIIKSRNLINFMNESKFFNFVSIGLPLKNRASIISKNFNFLNVFFYIPHNQNNNKKASLSLQKINRFYNRTHEGYYRFILEKDFDKFTNKLQRLKKMSDFSAIIEFYVNQFDEKMIKKIINIILENKMKIHSVILRNKNKKIDDIFYLSFREYNSDIYVNSKNLQFTDNLMIKNIIYDYVYYTISLLSILFWYFKNSIFKLRKFIKNILN